MAPLMKNEREVIPSLVSLAPVVSEEKPDARIWIRKAGGGGHAAKAAKSKEWMSQEVDLYTSLTR